MALTVVTGMANAGKSGVLYEPLAQAAERGGRATLLLPSHAEVGRAKQEFSRRAPVGVTITGIDAWSSSLWSRVGDGRRLSDALSRYAAVSAALEDAGATFGRAAPYEGLRRLLREVCERSAGFTLAPTDDTTEQLARVIERYRAVLRSWGQVDAGEVLLALAARLDDIEGPVALNRFVDLSPQQERFVIDMAGLTDVSIALPYVDGAYATEALSPLVDRLVDSGANRVVCDDDAPSGELEHFVAQLFEGVAVASEGAVTFVEVDSPEAEAAAVAEAAAAALSQGVAPERTAIVFSDVSSRGTAVEAALAARGIKAEVDATLRFDRTRFGRAFMLLTELTMRQMGGREELVAFLSGEYSDADPIVSVELDRAWRRRRTLSTRRMLKDAARSGVGVSHVIECAAQAMGEPISAVAWKRLADVLFALGQGGRSGIAASMDAMAHRMVVETADRLASIPAPIPAARFAAALADSTVSIGAAERRGCVVVTESHRVRGRRFDSLIVGGLTASEFSAGRGEPLAFSLLNGMGVRAGTEDHLAQRLLFHVLTTRARNSLTLVRQSTDQRGEPQRASAFWDEAMELYTSDDGVVSAPVQHLGIVQPDRAAPVYSTRRSAVRERIFTGEFSPPSAIRGRLARADICGGQREYSVTEIETYLSCPYRWFYDRTIRPRSLDPSFDARRKGSFAHALLASAYRALRAEGVERIGPESIDRGREVIGEQARRLAEESTVSLVGAAEELAWNQAVQWGVAALEQDQEVLEPFRPIYEEYEFGTAAGRPFEFAGVGLRGFIDRVDVGEEGVVVTDYKSGSQIKGQASWTTDGSLQPLIYSLAAAEHTGLPPVAGLYRSLPTGVMRGYWNRDESAADPCIKANDVVDSSAVRELVCWAQDEVARAVAGMVAGRIGPEPRDGACTYCGARDFCGERQ